MYRLVVLVFVFASVSVSQAQLSYAKIAVPGAVSTEARGINNTGEIVGFYRTVVCGDNDIVVPNCPTKGFKYVNKRYVKLMVPKSRSTAILGVNDFGDLVGFYAKRDGTTHGFLWLHTNVIKTIDFPGVSVFTTVPIAINKAGTIVGGLWAIISSGTFPSVGFVWKNGTFSKMNLGPVGCLEGCTSINGISNSGVISGQAFRVGSWAGFLKADKDIDFFKYQRGDTRFTGVNNNTDILAFSERANDVFIGFWAKHIELGEGKNDSTEVKPAFVLLNFPGGNSTVPFSVNDARAIVGTYTDSHGNQQGFFAK